MITAILADDNCVWNYKCCAFKEVNGKVSCTKMCEPEISCGEATASDVEIFNEREEPEIQLAAFMTKATPCIRGFQYRNGKCRRVYGETKERN